MSYRKAFFLLIFALISFQSQIFAQLPDFSGTWVLNLNKSKLEQKPEGLTGSVFILKQDGANFKLKRYHYYGEKKKKLSFKMIADGKTRTIKLLFKGKLEQKENSLLSTLWRKNFLNIVNYRFGGSQDEFIADEVFTGEPQNHHNIWVFDREVKK